mmetsp:Transcript_2377/g.4618  ORF Transcript_2377/g.4618 Transcript_2377/m.4618 type:complete len:113 (-) Transcript_2377:109-447(-)|eukprot:CAMPEP_0202723792 /NCGR_PEP_ID=MMETSP1385-20130828/168556_1 /ASSEMBLY_ACC=CAM_ASM_000861 /TAXON_ID=933848 /ORGANISM="Elphidium margaritaceum" /LENGTH=112 /DNA_ID=CAMNT_0049389149 /DNA_START=16 /DNA_END=354 /DNA_ORIENTATION=+
MSTIFTGGIDYSFYGANGGTISQTSFLTGKTYDITKEAEQVGKVINKAGKVITKAAVSMVLNGLTHGAYGVVVKAVELEQARQAYKQGNHMSAYRTLIKAGMDASHFDTDTK